MNPKSYRVPTTPPQGRVRCPVCHQAVYSRAGIHPQCAVRQADPPRPRAHKGAVVDGPAVAAGEPAEPRPNAPVSDEAPRGPGASARRPAATP